MSKPGSAPIAEKWMEYKGVEYSVVQLTDDTGWRWEIKFSDGITKTGCDPDKSSSGN